MKETVEKKSMNLTKMRPVGLRHRVPVHSVIHGLILQETEIYGKILKQIGC